MDMPDILALDLATNLGWARGKIGEDPAHGALRLAAVGSTPGEIGRGFLRWFKDQMAFKPAFVTFEAPMPPSQMAGKTTAQTARILMGLAFMAESCATSAGIRYIREVRVRDVRNHFIGSGPKSAIAKRMTIERCQQVGWDPIDDNAADALALWDYQSSILRQKLKLQPKSGPLFQRRRS